MKKIISGVCFLFAAVPAFALEIGVNAGVTTRETPAEVVAKYKLFQTYVAKRMGGAVNVVPVSSAAVADSVKAAKFDAMVVHTHIPYRMKASPNWTMAAITVDTRDNVIYFLARAKEAASDLQVFLGREMVVPGTSSFATLAARAEVKARGLDYSKYRVKVTAYQDSLPYYLENNFASIGVTRLKSIADGWQKAGGKVVAKTSELPVYGLLVNKALPPDLMQKLVDAITTFEDEAFTKDTNIVRFVRLGEEKSTALTRYFGDLN